jgi:hypothetical protein
LTSKSFRCSDASLARDEPLFATASVVPRWLLVEQPGSWGENALTESRLPAVAGRELRARAAAAGVRIILIRRGRRFSSGRRHCYFARTTQTTPYLAEMSLDSLDDLVDVDLAPLREAGEIEGAAMCRRPVFLVCTHGRHDACCSIRGNQVSRLACAKPGDHAWECSHIGGDRFAANLVCFPHGVYYGRVDPGHVADLMDTYSAERLALDLYRGRCCYPFPLQAAEYFARRELGILGIEDLVLVESARSDDGSVGTFSLRDGRLAEVEVTIDRSGEPHRLTCGLAAPAVIPRYELVSMTLSS